MNIKELILETSPPFEWNTREHPIQKLGNFFFGIAEGFSFDKKKVNEASDTDLWKLYALINKYWLDNYQEWNRRTENMVFNMKNNIEIKKDDIGKNLLEVYEAKYDWRS